MRNYTDALHATRVDKQVSCLHVKDLHSEADRLQTIHGSPGLNAIHGAGCTARPRVMFVFMNPTARNIAAESRWGGIRAPWLGTRVVWRLFCELGLLTSELFELTQRLRVAEWTPTFAHRLYEHFAEQRVYITNLAKCTLDDARPLPNAVFREYIALLHAEVDSIQPDAIVSFGNQVSSILLQRPVSVSSTDGVGFHINTHRGATKVVPTHYPVGQGLRNMPLAVARLRPLLGT
jgi:DNA polymerase